MNQAQFRFVRDLLSNRRHDFRRRIENEVEGSFVEPEEVKAARKVIEAWQRYRSDTLTQNKDRASRIFDEIENQFIAAVVKGALGELKAGSGTVDLGPLEDFKVVVEPFDPSVLLKRS